MLQELSTSINFPISSSKFNPICQRSISFSSQHPTFINCLFTLPSPQPFSSLFSSSTRRTRYPFLSFSSVSNYVEQLADKVAEAEDDSYDFSANKDAETFEFEASLSSTDLKQLDPPSIEAMDLDEISDKWRRSRLAWLCKQLPTHRQGSMLKILNGQKNWFRQDDLTYVAVHCMRIRENETGFRVYKWAMQQAWFRFDFALASKLADYLGRDGNYSKCRQLFDDIINQGRVPSEYTFHCLIVAYLSAPIQGCVDEACIIYNRMIQLGGYQPRLALHNSLFRALVTQSGELSKHYLKQAEFIFHNLVTSGLEIKKDIYGGLIWLHSYQDTIDKERIMALRDEMRRFGIKEDRNVLVSILRSCSKEGEIEETERIWAKLMQSNTIPPSQAFVYKMEVYSKAGDPMKSLEIFREVQKNTGHANAVSYHKIIEICSRARKVELAETLMKEFTNADLKPLLRSSFANLMKMYLRLDLHGKVEESFDRCLDKCRLSRTIYIIYLDSLVRTGDLDKAEKIFNEMLSTAAIGVSSTPCNAMLTLYLAREDYAKAERVYNLMLKKKYEIRSELLEKMERFLSLRRKTLVKREKRSMIVPKLNQEQREILIGLLLGGLKIESNADNRDRAIHFEFNEKLQTHSILRRIVQNQFHEWLHPSCKQEEEREEGIPYKNLFTIPHSCFAFYAEQFRPDGVVAVPKLIHRWISPGVVAYWYMYKGRRCSSGDVLLKLRGREEDAERVVRALRGRGLDCKVKRKGSVFWLGFLGDECLGFWRFVDPYIDAELKNE